MFVLFSIRRKNLLIVRLFLIFFALISIFFAVSTGSRGPILAAIMSLFITVMLAPGFKRYRLRVMSVLALIGIAAIPFIRGNAAEGAGRISSLLAGEGDTSTEARERLWGSAYRTMGENPFFGIGWGAFSERFGTYPHNLVLELTAEAGIIITTIFIVFIIFSLVRSLRAAIDIDNIIFFCLLLFSFIMAMVSNDFNGNRLLLVCLFNSWATTRGIKRPRVAHPEIDQRE